MPALSEHVQLEGTKLLMYGKFFASTFTGSMAGSGPDTFAVWGYVIAHTKDSQVELNPVVVGAVIGMPPDRVKAVIDTLCAPDPQSRNPAHDGRRLLQEGPFIYRVVSHENYRSIRSEDDRRAYNREKQRESRARRRASNQAVNDSQAKSALSAQSEAEAEADTEADPEGEAPSAPATPKLRQAALKKAPKAKGWKIVPESWQPNDKHRETAAEEGKDFDRELAKFRDHEFKDPKTDANRAFANWLRREDYGKANGSTRPLNKSEVSQRNAMAVVGKYEREEKALAQKQ